ncbi:MAG: aldolase/citrate lyase family protein, partial [Solirubrobacteraceae bacterium]
LGPGRATAYGRELPAYFDAANERTLVAVQVETASGLEHLDEITTDGDVDIVFIGPGDLAASLGASLRAPSREFEQTVSEMVARVQAAGAVAGIFAANPEAAARWIEQGVRLVIMGSDLGLLAASAADAVAQVRNRTGRGS